jgi:hypothetical protein
MSLVRPESDKQERTWSINVLSQSFASNITMISLAIWGDSTCVSGFTFKFSDGSSRTVGTNFGVQSPFLTILNFLNNSNYLAFYISLTTVTSYIDNVVYALKLCNSEIECVIGGNKFIPMNYNATISTDTVITAFWGSYGSNSIGQRRCLKDFGMDLLTEQFN